ncbi:MAG: MEMO1 family protein [Candidatus Omnitrophota bacterium]|nr:MEMO1 family protein [Candidatus Omnitrophota bacterium]
MLRDPAVAGQFYPASASILKKKLAELCPKVKSKKEAIALLLPHAGYMYSGRVAAATISSVNLKDTFIIIGPNHTGIGLPFSMDTEEIWQTPLGKVEINLVLAAELLKKSPYLKNDLRAHSYEHSIEVELPFLQYLKCDTSFSFVPIVIGGGDLDVYKQIGKAIAEAIKELKLTDRIQIIASSDMTHYETAEAAKNKDNLAIAAILKLDADLLFETVKKEEITMCGYAPAVIMLSAARALGAKKAELVKYENSGDTTGDYSSVVGYAGVTIN